MQRSRLRRQLTRASSSFEVEVRALSVAVEVWDSLPDLDGHVVNCSDSRSALDFLCLPTDRERPEITKVGTAISSLRRELVLQLVLGH